MFDARLSEPNQTSKVLSMMPVTTALLCPDVPPYRPVSHIHRGFEPRRIRQNYASSCVGQARSTVAHEGDSKQHTRSPGAASEPFSLDTDLTRNTRAPHFTPQHWLLCHMGLY